MLEALSAVTIVVTSAVTLALTTAVTLAVTTAVMTAVMTAMTTILTTAVMINATIAAMIDKVAGMVQYPLQILYTIETESILSTLRSKTMPTSSHLGAAKSYRLPP